MIRLNLPPFDYRIRQVQGKVWIFDIIRKKFLVLTPEEWVRQHVVHYLCDHLHYPKSMIKAEMNFSYGELKKRSDLVVFNREGEPWILIECKAPEVVLSRETVHQLLSYNQILSARYVVITNGLHLFCQDRNNPEKLLTSLPDYKAVD
ncbi:MAG: type I restriction enzyme HsdR N-terminal domain-containing protein [Cyclobacteriaceae bacterium]|jgi:hypothetical protein|nr:type I restriction enzyme HsdR N-terminal domain-containing protein [Cyclobacteriaceae bacterium]